MDTTVINTLKKNKTKPCVSVIIPTHKTSHTNASNEPEINKALNKAKDLILNKYGKNDQAIELINRISELSENLDYNANDHGLGFFVSPDVACLVKFPFPVKEKVIINNIFELRDVLYLEETLINYYVLLITEKEVKLFKGSGEDLHMIKDKNFPMHFFDDYEYTHTSLGSSNGYSLKSTEKDRSIIKEQRFMANLKQVDQKISNYIMGNIPLIISGDSKDLGYYKKISAHYKYVAGKINGNYAHENIHKLGQLVFEKIKEYLKQEEKKVLSRLGDAIGKKLAVFGITDVLNAAKEGKGLLLLVEKDFTLPLSVNKEGSLSLADVGNESLITNDIIDEVVETVIDKKGTVVVFENGKLDRFDGIALILRYW